MAKLTGKLQVTIPKRIADKYGLTPGDEVEFRAAGGGIRVVKASGDNVASAAERLELFDRATARQRARQRGAAPSGESSGRGWTRDALYDRGRAR
jgi:AbrB family looped-hinge helix DNA binding protein